MSSVTFSPVASAPCRQDWLSSLALHGGVLLGFIWLGTSQMQRTTQALDLELSWAPEQVTSAPATPVATPPEMPKPPLSQPVSRPNRTPGKSSVPALARAQPAPEPLRSEPDVALSSPASTPAEVAQPAPARADMDSPSGETAARTAAQAPAAAAPTAPADDTAYQQWRSRLEQALQQQKHYPPSARRMGQAGKVTVQLRLGPDGALIACAVASSSGFQALDKAAEQLVRSVAQAMKAHARPGRETDIRVPIVYALTES